MLTKLLKYEGRTTARVLLPVGGGVLVFALITSLVNFILDRQTAVPEMAWWLQALLNMVAALALFFVVAACVFVNIQRFYKLLGEQGYLMFSLPVPVWNHMAVKLISACLWSALCVLYLIFCGSLLSGSFALRPLWENLSWTTPTDVTALLFLALLAVALVAGAYLDCYLACAIGAQFGQQRLLASIVSYFILGFLQQILATVVLVLLVFGSVQMDSLWLMGLIHSLDSFWGMVVVLSGILLGVVALDAIKWAVTQWLLSSRLHLI